MSEGVLLSARFIIVIMKFLVTVATGCDMWTRF
jgi:hypothetical protein